MDPNLEALAGSVKGLLRGRLDHFLDANKDRKAFRERLEGMTQLCR